MSDVPPKTQLSFTNTEIAFSGKSDKELELSYWLFRVINNNFLVKIGPPLTAWAMRLGLPVAPLIRATIFKHFCGGESIEDCKETVAALGTFGIGTILDYSVEGKEREEDFETTTLETIRTIREAHNNPGIPFCVFKVTGLARFALLEKLQSTQGLSPQENKEWERVQERVERICHTAHELNVPVFIDAEESWIQDPIDGLAHTMMRRYNITSAIVYNTVQLYRDDRLTFLKQSYEEAAGSYYLGVKLVRGAYMEKERARAGQKGYPSPIQADKKATDRDFDEALRFCIEHIDRIAICAGTHNEQSCLLLTSLMEEKEIETDHPHVYFSQLLGMSDHISYNLANAGYNVAKYVPYGPVKAVLPYLFRRANENTSISGQMGRELSLIIAERKRRKKSNR